MKLSKQGEKVLAQLKAKRDDDKRMPSIKSIHNLLTELNIEHDFDTTLNVVEYSSGNNNWVNSRHDGKRGYEIKRVDGKYLGMDTADSYYSWNSFKYAIDLLEIIENN